MSEAARKGMLESGQWPPFSICETGKLTLPVVSRADGQSRGAPGSGDRSGTGRGRHCAHRKLLPASPGGGTHAPPSLSPRFSCKSHQPQRSGLAPQIVKPQSWEQLSQQGGSGFGWDCGLGPPACLR